MLDMLSRPTGFVLCTEQEQPVSMSSPAVGYVCVIVSTSVTDVSFGSSQTTLEKEHRDISKYPIIKKKKKKVKTLKVIFAFESGGLGRRLTSRRTSIHLNATSDLYSKESSAAC